MEVPVFLGSNIRNSKIEQLRKVEIEDLIAQIKQVDGDLNELCRRLRGIWRIDRNAYKQVKTQLPFFCLSDFTNGIRKLEHFISAFGLVLDIDIPEKDKDLQKEIFNKVVQHPSVFLAFHSPSGCGIKLLFYFNHPIKSAFEYTKVYKLFASFFAREYELGNYLDYSTCDATRVCFLSTDIGLFFNLSALKLDTNAILKNSIDQELFSDLKLEENLNDLPYEQIKETLFPEKSIKRPKMPIYVPALLQEISPIIEEAIKKVGIEVMEINIIQYGLKFKCKKKFDLGEINVFYGKKGFSIVISPKSETSPSLNAQLQNCVANEIYKGDRLWVGMHMENNFENETIQKSTDTRKPF